MALLLNIASGRLTTCQELVAGGFVQDAIDEIKILLDGDPDHVACEQAKTIADDINTGITLHPCDSKFSFRHSKTIPPSLIRSPNPISSYTIIHYTIPDRILSPRDRQLPDNEPENKNVILKIYDIMGREVRTLVEGIQQAGNYTIDWDGKNFRGDNVPSGIYFYRLQTGDITSSKKLILIR
jgi:hypothetical protein